MGANHHASEADSEVVSRPPDPLRDSLIRTGFWIAGGALVIAGMLITVQSLLPGFDTPEGPYVALWLVAGTYWGMVAANAFHSAQAITSWFSARRKPMAGRAARLLTFAYEDVRGVRLIGLGVALGAAAQVMGA